MAESRQICRNLTRSYADIRRTMVLRTSDCLDLIVNATMEPQELAHANLRTTNEERKHATKNVFLPKHIAVHRSLIHNNAFLPNTHRCLAAQWKRIRLVTGR